MFLRPYATAFSLTVACCGMSPTLLAAGSHALTLAYADGENLAKALDFAGVKPHGSGGNSELYEAAAIACTPAGACSVTTTDGTSLAVPDSALPANLARSLQRNGAYLDGAEGDAQLGGQHIRCERQNDPYAEATCTLTVRD